MKRIDICIKVELTGKVDTRYGEVDGMFKSRIKTV